MDATLIETHKRDALHCYKGFKPAPAKAGGVSAVKLLVGGTGCDAVLGVP
jgi:hypothetical protein